MKTEFLKLIFLTQRNIKLYFKNKFTFFVSLITPLILLLLFITFLKSTYENTILNIIGDFKLNNKIINAFTGGWLFSSVLSTSCITVSFCSGMMIYDKINKSDIDFMVSPVNNMTIKVAYVIANLLSTLIICAVLLTIGLIYLSIVGFYLSFADLLLILLNIILTSLFGTLIANIVWCFVNSEGGMSGICTLISAMYGFICGAYMPINVMGNTMKNVTAFLPGTYSMVLFRKFFLTGVLDEMANYLPQEMTDIIAENFDVSFTALNNELSVGLMFLIIFSCVAVAFGILLQISILNKNKHIEKSKPVELNK